MGKHGDGATECTCADIERRLRALEANTHPPFNFSDLIHRLEVLERAIAILESAQEPKP